MPFSFKRMNIYLLNINKVTEEVIEVVKTKLPSRFEYACKYKMREDFLRSIAGSYLLYKYCNFVRDDLIKYSKSGKPYLENGPYFNIAHSKDYTAIVFDTNEIGLDIEFIDLKRNLNNIPYITNEFKGLHPTQEELFSVWCMKESYVKMSGKGISELPNVNLKDFNHLCFNKTLFFNDYVISVSSVKEILDIKFIED